MTDTVERTDQFALNGDIKTLQLTTDWDFPREFVFHTLIDFGSKSRIGRV
jgi:hypothetical protein